MTSSGVQMDYDVELSSEQFKVRGDLLFAGSKQYPYVFVNATLEEDDRAIITSRYLMMQIEPDLKFSFEICKSCHLLAGEYDCVLCVEGPDGIIAEDVRKVSLAKVPSEIGEWSQSEEAAFWMMVEENERKKDGGSEDSKEAGEGREEPLEEDESRADADEAVSAVRTEGITDSRPDESRRATEETENVSKSENESIELSSGDLAEAECAGSASEEVDSLVGSITSKKYHRPDCRYAQKIKPENLISFKSIEDARGQGYIPCKVCSP